MVSFLREFRGLARRRFVSDGHEMNVPGHEPHGRSERCYAIYRLMCFGSAARGTVHTYILCIMHIYDRNTGERWLAMGREGGVD